VAFCLQNGDVKDDDLFFSQKATRKVLKSLGLLRVRMLEKFERV